MSGKNKESSKLAESILTATSSALLGTAATEKSQDPSDSTPFVPSPFAQKLKLGEILPLLPDQNQTPGWLVLGGPGPADSLMAVEATDVSAVVWDSGTNKIFISTRSNGLVALDCSALSHCPAPSWQRRVVFALLVGLIDRLPLPFTPLSTP